MNAIILNDTEARIASIEPETAEIVRMGEIHGDRMIDVTVRNHGRVRVALDWEDIDIETNTLTDFASETIEAKVKKATGADEVEWNLNA